LREQQEPMSLSAVPVKEILVPSGDHSGSPWALPSGDHYDL
jgi:hypothetical protein